MENKALWFAAAVRAVGGGRWAVVALRSYPTRDLAEASREGMAAITSHATKVWPPAQADVTSVRNRDSAINAAIREEVVRLWGEQTAVSAEAARVPSAATTEAA